MFLIIDHFFTVTIVYIHIVVCIVYACVSCSVLCVMCVALLFFLIFYRFSSIDRRSYHVFRMVKSCNNHCSSSVIQQICLFVFCRPAFFCSQAWWYRASSSERACRARDAQIERTRTRALARTTGWVCASVNTHAHPHLYILMAAEKRDLQRVRILFLIQSKFMGFFLLIGRVGLFL